MKKLLIFSFLVVSFGLGFSQTASDFYNEGVKKYDAKDYQGALNDYNQAINLKPDHADALYNRGMCKYMLYKYSEAIVDFKLSNAVSPMYDVYYMIGLCYYFDKKYSEAVQEFNTSINMKSDYAKSYLYRGAAKYYLAKDDEALVDLGLAISLDPNNADAYYYRGLVKYQKADDNGAIEDFNASINIKPMYDAYHYRGNAKYMLKNYEGAASDYTMSLALNNQNTNAYIERGMAYYMLAKDDQAIADFSKAIEYNPKSGKAYYYRGQSKNYKGDAAGSKADLDMAKQLGYNAPGTTNTATDKNKSTTSSTISVPTMEWLSPVLDNMNISEESYLINACFKSSSPITTCKISVNGIENAYPVTKGSGSCQYTVSYTSPLKQGLNEITITVVNTKGEKLAETRKISVYSKNTSNEKGAEKRLALVIGNSNYANSGVLKNPVNDAVLMSKTLKELGFDVIVKTNADKKGMEEAVREFSKKMPNYNVLLFYYAGHGMQIDGVNYLLPIDVTLMDKSDAKFEAISVNYVVEELERYPDNTSVVILDACRNNPFRSFGRGGESGFKAINPASGTIISFATSEGSTASDGAGNNGLFTEELVKQMYIPQPIENVFKKTRVQVEKISNNQQSPQEWSKLKGDFYFKK